jgi:hypothetical protein
MESFKALLELKKKELGIEKKPRSERSALFTELYGYYQKSYKKNCWLDYLAWLKKNRLKHSKDTVEQYKKDKTFRKMITIKSFCSFWFGHIPTQDLYYLTSIAKDKDRRGENFNRWLFWAIKHNPQENSN